MVLTEVCGAFKSPQEASGAEKAGAVEGAVLPCSLAAPYLELSIYLTAPCKGDQNSSEGTIPVKT